MELKDRIAHIIRAQNLTNSQFAEKMEVQPANISHLLAGRNKPSFDFLVKLKEVFPEYSFDWIITGKKPITINEPMPMPKPHPFPPLPLMPPQHIVNPTTTTTPPTETPVNTSTPEVSPSQTSTFDLFNQPQEPETVVETLTEHQTFTQTQTTPTPQNISTPSPTKKSRISKIILIYDDKSFETLENKEI